MSCMMIVVTVLNIDYAAAVILANDTKTVIRIMEDEDAFYLCVL